MFVQRDVFEKYIAKYINLYWSKNEKALKIDKLKNYPFATTYLIIIVRVQ